MPTSETLGRLGLQSELLELVDAAVLAVDLAGRVIYANRYCSRLYGWSMDELLGARADDINGVVVDHSVKREIRDALIDRGSWEGTFDIRRKDGSIVAVKAIDSPLYDADGKLAGVISIALDGSQERDLKVRLAERTYEAEAFQFLAKCSAVMASSLDYTAAMKDLAAMCVSFLGDMCLIDVAEGDTIRRVAAAHRDPAHQPSVDLLISRFAPDPSGVHPAIRALHSGEAAMSADMSEEFLRATTRDDAHYQIVRELGFQSFICVPLTARGRTLGALTLVSCNENRRFGDRDLALATELAWRAALALDNARLYTEQANVARVLQASLLPPSLPDVPGAELAARYVAAGEGNDVGGDFYDVFDMGYGTWALVIGDVCGRGPEAAVTTGLIRHTLRSVAPRQRQPARILAAVNDTLLRESTSDENFSTVACALLRTRRDQARLTLACGGHPPPVIMSLDGTVHVPACRGSMLGVFEDASWLTLEVELFPGDLVVFYTDGVVEARRDGKFFGEDGLIAAIRARQHASVSAVADHILAERSRFTGTPPEDDVAILAFRLHVI